MKNHIIYFLLMIMLSLLLVGCDMPNDNNEDNKESILDKWNAIPESHNFEISIDDNDEITIIGVKNLNLEDLVVPNIVSYIAEGAFKECWEVTSLVIPESVKRIDEGAFSGCSSLESITLPFYGDMRRSSTDPVQHMFGYIFGREEYGDSYRVNSYSFKYIDDVPKDISVDYYIPHSLRNVVIADCEYIPIRAFDGCGSIRNITIPDNVKIIDNFAFNNCRITSINFPNGLTRIGNRAFWDCNKLTSITIPDSVTSIGFGAFNHCTSLESVTLSNNLTVIETGTFDQCSSLESIIIPSSVKEIKNGAFSHCTSLSSVTILDGVEKIGENAFDNCTNLTSITIPDSVTTIGRATFYECSNLKNVNISNNLTSIEQSVFAYCTSLASVTIPNSVTSIGNYAFSHCSSLTNIVIPNGVTFIGPRAFEYCKYMTKIVIPNSVTTIYSNAFDGCPVLGYVYFDGTIEEWKKIEFEDEKANPMYYAKHFYVLDEKGEVEYNGKQYTETKLE